MKIRSSLLVVLALMIAATVHAQTVITSLPYTITSGGLYVLNSNLNATVTSGNLITVNASNVTIDFQNHFISGSVGITSQSTTGISAYERSNLTIQNGTIAYCMTGIYISGNGSATTNNVDQIINNMRITYCYGDGMVVNDAPSSRITNCLISQIGYSTASFADGIVLAGPGITVQGCSISNIIASAGETTYCINADPGEFIRQNQFSNATYGVFAGIYQDNLAHACTSAFAGGTDAGGNTHD